MLGGAYLPFSWSLENNRLGRGYQWWRTQEQERLQVKRQGWHWKGREFWGQEEAGWSVLTVYRRQELLLMSVGWNPCYTTLRLKECSPAGWDEQVLSSPLPRTDSKERPGQTLHIPLATQCLGNLSSRLIFCSINLDFDSVLKIFTQTRFSNNQPGAEQRRASQCVPEGPPLSSVCQSVSVCTWRPTVVFCVSVCTWRPTIVFCGT